MRCPPRTFPPMRWLRTVPERKLREMTSTRVGEVRLGEEVQALDAEGRAPAGVRHVVIGVPEDIGVRANLGRPGARRMWKEALGRLLHVQSNPTLDPRTVAIGGAVDVRDLQREGRETDRALGRAREAAASEGRRAGRAAQDATVLLGRLRDLCAQVDERVDATVHGLREQGLFPIVIGGGHNNALGILTACARSAGRPMHCVNVDPHADMRPAEGRHSGNAFTYARASGALDRYAVVGLQECTATASILESLADGRSGVWTLDAMARGEISLHDSLDGAVRHVGAGPATLELDLDAVAGAPASAVAGSGLTALEMRTCAARLSRELDLHAAHIAEGAPGLGAWPEGLLGKLVAELTLDIIKGTAARGRA